MTIIAKDAENILDINELYDLGVVLFETTVLLVNNLEFSICWVEFEKLYDISVQNQEHTQIIEYNVVKELSDIQKTYFNLLKGETYEDEHGNIVKCISHSIEYGL